MKHSPYRHIDIEEDVKSDFNGFIWRFSVIYASQDLLMSNNSYQIFFFFQYKHKITSN